MTHAWFNYKMDGLTTRFSHTSSLPSITLNLFIHSTRFLSRTTAGPPPLWQPITVATTTIRHCFSVNHQQTRHPSTKTTAEHLHKHLSLSAPAETADHHLLVIAGHHQHPTNHYYHREPPSHHPYVLYPSFLLFPSSYSSQNRNTTTTGRPSRHHPHHREPPPQPRTTSKPFVYNQLGHIPTSPCFSRRVPAQTEALAQPDHLAPPTTPPETTITHHKTSPFTTLHLFPC